MTTNGNNHYVFVYGSLKSGFGNNRVLSTTNNYGFQSGTAEKYGEGITFRRDFEMLSMGGFPGVVEGGNQAIWGEVWIVDNEKLSRLDAMERIPHFYNRIEIEVILDDGELVKAYMYVLSDKVPEQSTYYMSESTADRARKNAEFKAKNPSPWDEKRIELLDIDGVIVANWLPSDWEQRQAKEEGAKV